MIVGREQIIYFENLAKHQERIYPDAADYGVDVGGELFGIKIEARKNLVALMESFKVHVDKWGHTESSHGSTTTIFIPYEKDGGRYVGVELRISHAIDCVRKKEFLSVDLRRCSTMDDPWKN